jgi:TolB-like protein
VLNGLCQQQQVGRYVLYRRTQTPQRDQTIFPLFGLPDSAARMLVIVAGVGLIPALILSWAFELTPEGLKKESEVDRSQSADQAKGKTFDRTVMVVLALALAYFAIDKFVLSESRMESARQEARSQALTESAELERSERSIAVLPFATTGTDAALVSYASGLTHELRDRISGYQELQTIIAVSDASPDSVSPNSVTYLVEGGVQPIGDERRVRVHLVRSADRHVVWSETYDETETDAADPAVLASTMGRFVRLQLVQDQECQAVKRKSHSMDAAALVCAAQAQNYRVNQRGAFDPQLMRTNAERAVSLDPDLLEAYQVLPVAYIFLGAYGQLSVEEASRLAHVALERALAIEPDDAYTSHRKRALTPECALVSRSIGQNRDSSRQSSGRVRSLPPRHQGL